MNKKALIIALSLGAIAAVASYDMIVKGKSVKTLAGAIVSSL